jgi:hypothetical protein
VSRVDGRGAPASNYGWDTYEGTERYTDGRDDPPRLVQPVAEYDHSDGSCSVTGGVVVRDRAVPALVGRYLFSDFCSGFLRAIDVTDPDAEAEDLTRRRAARSARVVVRRRRPGRVLVVDHDGGIRRLAAAEG